MARGLFIAGMAVLGALSVGPVPSGLLPSEAPRPDRSTAPSPVVDVPGRPVSLPAPAAKARPVAERPKLTLLTAPDEDLHSDLGPLLPPGLTVRQAARGFGDARQFASAVHVARNLGIPFPRLKAKVVDEGLSIGQAIQVLRPDADVWGELMRARAAMARQEVR